MERSFLEAVFARGDRRLSQVLWCAHRRGIKFDDWSEFFDYSAWLDVFADAGIDPKQYAYRQYQLDEPLPWDHIRPYGSKDYLLSEYKKAFADRQQLGC